MSNLAIEVDSRRGLVLVTPATSITVDDARIAFKEIVGMPEFHKGMPSLWDLRYTELMHINAKDNKTLSEFANEIKEQRGVARIAIVVGSDLGFGLARMFELLNEATHLQARVFRTMDVGQR